MNMPKSASGGSTYQCGVFVDSCVVMWFDKDRWLTSRVS